MVFLCATAHMSLEGGDQTSFYPVTDQNRPDVLVVLSIGRVCHHKCSGYRSVTGRIQAWYASPQLKGPQLSSPSFRVHRTRLSAQHYLSRALLCLMVSLPLLSPPSHPRVIALVLFPNAGLSAADHYSDDDSLSLHPLLLDRRSSRSVDPFSSTRLLPQADEGQSAVPT